MKEIMNIQNTDYWFKVLQFLKQNWALIDDAPDGGVTVYFIHSDSGVFDQMNEFSTLSMRQFLHFVATDSGNTIRKQTKRQARLVF